MCGRKTNLHGGVAGFLHEFYDFSLVFAVVNKISWII